MLPAQPNRSLMDGIGCLQALAMSQAPAGVRDLARMLGLETTRTHRLLKTLAHLGLARQTVDRKYLPGPAMHVLAAQSLFGSGLLKRALPWLRSLGDLGFDTALGVLWKDQVCYLYHAQVGMSSDEGIGRVGLFPATFSSIGMVLLAAKEEGEIRDLYRGRAIPGFLGMEGLLGVLEKVRKSGFACVINAKCRTHRSLGVPVQTPPIAGLALSGPIPARKVRKLVRELWRASKEIGVEDRKGERP